MDLDAFGRVCHHHLLEFLLDAALVEQVEDAHQPQRAIEEILAALFHLVQDILDIRHAVSEVALHVLSIHRQLRFHILQGRQVGLEQVQAGGDHIPVLV